MGQRGERVCGAGCLQRLHWHNNVYVFQRLFFPRIQAHLLVRHAAAPDRRFPLFGNLHAAHVVVVHFLRSRTSLILRTAWMMILCGFSRLDQTLTLVS